MKNSFGQIVITGRAIPFEGEVSDQPKISTPEIINAQPPHNTNLATNSHSISSKPDITNIDEKQLKKIKFLKSEQSNVAKGKIVLSHQLPPVKALPMRFKDGATSNVQYLDVEQGLSCSFIYDVKQDKAGNLWIATDGYGLCKYDGVNFFNYTEEQGLVNNIVLKLLIDKNENIWVATQGGVSVFDGKTFTNFTKAEGLLDDNIIDIFQDNEKNMWLSSPGGISKYDGKDFIHYTAKEGLPGDTVFTCIQDANGNMWFGTSHGVVKFDGETFTLYTEKDGLAPGIIICSLLDRKNNIWFGSNNGGLTRYDGKSFTKFSKHQGLTSNFIWSLLEDRTGNVWIGTAYGGIYKYDGTSFTNYNYKEGLSNSKVRRITEDKNGNIWFGTDGGGVNKLSATSFDYLFPDSVFENNRVRPILKDQDGKIWFGTEGGGVAVFDGKKIGYYKKENGFKYFGQRSLLQDQSGNIWIGATGFGIIKFDGHSFTNYSVKQGLSENSVMSMLEDDNDLWLGLSFSGVNKFHGKNFIHYGQKQGLPPGKILSILKDENKNIWFCSDAGGLIKFDGSTITIYSEKEGLFCRSISTIFEDRDHQFWLGTLGAGLCKFDGKNFTYFTEKQGLSNNTVWSITQDSTGKIWVGTDKGLNVLFEEKNSSNYSIYNFGLQDGLKAIDFNLRSVAIDNNNRIWWGTGKGLASLDLNKKLSFDSVCSMRLSYVEINDKNYDFLNFPRDMGNNIKFSSVSAFDNYPDQLTLSHDQNHLSFHFAAIDWSAPERIKYSYRLLGVEDSWSTPSDNPVAEYRNLGQGSFQFQVKAISQSQIWTTPFIYDFTIQPAWWQTLIFKITLIVLMVGILMFIVRLIYLSRLRKQKNLLEKQIAVQLERQRISSEMHDDVGAGLSGIKLLTELAKSKITDKTAAIELEKIHHSVGNISANMKEVIWSLDAGNDHLENLILYLQKQTRKLLENYFCDLKIDISENIPEALVSGAARRNIYLIVKESINNIIKHSGADQVHVSFYCKEKLVITIADNGKGLSEQTDNSGNGLKNIRERVKQLNGELTIKNQDGLTLRFEIPLKSN